MHITYALSENLRKHQVHQEYSTPLRAKQQLLRATPGEYETSSSIYYLT